MRRLSPLVLLAAALLAACNSLSPAAQQHLEVFETYWHALADGYPFFASKHLDWQAIGAQYRSAVVHAKTPVEFYHLIAGMLCELQDPHVSLDVPAANWNDGEDAGDGDDGKIVSLFAAADLHVMGIERRLFVAGWPEGQAPVPPTHLHGDAARWPEIVELEGHPVSLPLLPVLARGRPGTPAELRLAWSDGTRSRHVVRRPTAGRDRLALGLGRSYGMAVERRANLAVLRLDTMDPESIGLDHEQFADRLQACLDETATADGIVLDLRNNGGGASAVVGRIVGRFLSAPYRSILAAQRTNYLFGLLSVVRYGTVDWDPRPPRIDKPVCVLTSWRTGSAAEHVARILQIACGAIVVGERTAGAEAFLESVRGPDGSTLVYGKDRAMEISGRGLQNDGVIPDIVVRLSLDDVARCGSYAAALKDWNERVLAAAEQALRDRTAR